MTGNLLRQLLALPAPLISGQNRLSDEPVLSPRRRQLNLSHPTGWLAAHPSLHTFSCAAGEVHFSRKGATAFAVGVEGMSGDLLGSWARAMRAEKCRRTLLFPVARWQTEALKNEGFDLMKVGEEAEVYLPSYRRRGGSHANLRQMLGRAKRNKLSVTVDTHLSDTARALESIWLGQCAQAQRMQLLVGEYNLCEEAVFAVVRNAQGHPIAWVEGRPGFSDRGFGIDSMIRHPDAPPGAIEMAVDALLSHRKQQGDTWFSLGAVPLRGVDYSRPLLGLICQILRESHLGNQLFHFSGLGQFKTKFSPRWRPVFIGDYQQLNAFSLYEGCRLWGLF